MAVKINGCVFVKSWTCPVESDDVPLEVCRICVEARKTQPAVINRTATISRASKVFPTKPVHDTIGHLNELDKQFEKNEISPEEYVEKRKNILESAR